MNRLMLKITLAALLSLAITFANAENAPNISGPAPALPPGVVNTQNPNDKPLPPEEALKKITVPEGFQVTLFADEHNVMQHVAINITIRHRLGVDECFSYPAYKSHI